MPLQCASVIASKSSCFDSYKFFQIWWHQRRPRSAKETPHRGFLQAGVAGHSSIPAASMMPELKRRHADTATLIDAAAPSFRGCQRSLHPGRESNAAAGGLPGFARGFIRRQRESHTEEGE